MPKTTSTLPPDTRWTNVLMVLGFVAFFAGFLTAFKTHDWWWFAVGVSVCFVAAIVDLAMRSYQANKGTTSAPTQDVGVDDDEI